MNDKIRTIKPEFKNIRIDETHCYIDEIRAKFGKIYSLHLFDKSENTYLCSMSPSYYLHYLGTVVEFKNEGDEENDEFYDDAVAFVTETRRGSISSVQRKFRIGYNRAARIVEDMENQGVVSTPGHNGAREVLAPPPVRD